jgi:ABC-type nitrate/sulfonate/bicarbonate transport system ATPase subunit
VGDPKLAIVGLSKAFYQERLGRWTPVLEEIDLAVAEREFVAIVGPSGCGKTTLLRIAAGLILPSHGEVLVDGRRVLGPGRDRAMVFQDPALLPWRTVLGNMAYGVECLRVPPKQALAVARPWLELVGLEGFDQHYPHEISGGMQQRVNLARALAVDPQILLMDEPFAALDAQTRESMQSELLTVWARAPKTVVFVTHDIGEALYLADRVVVLTARPARIREVVPVTLPRPRDHSVRRMTGFRDWEDHIRHLLK